jgi:hypothetical protein
MRCIGLFAVVAISMPAFAIAQTEGTPAIAREVFGREVERAAARVPVVVEQRVVPRRIAVQAIQPPSRWWDTLAKSRCGYYDDAYFDDNWYYDYYEAAAPTRGTDVRYRTPWLYSPVAERGLFHFQTIPPQPR